MNKKTKKIIAREFLYLLGTTVFYFGILFAWLILSDLNNEKDKELTSEIAALTEIKKIPYRLRICYIINNDKSLSSSWGRIDDTEKFISKLKTDTEMVSSLYNFVNKNDNRMSISEKTFRENINNDTKSEDYLIKINNLEHELETNKDSIFSHSIGELEVYGFAIILYSIVFLLRYLIYGTKWSIQQLKE